MTDVLTKLAAGLFIGAIWFPLLVLLGRIVERRWPARADQPWSEVVRDYKMVAVNFGMNWLLSPLVAIGGVAVVNLAGGGLVKLPGHNWWWFVFSVAIFAIVGDFIGYLIHRAQHAVPALWAMHSLHHSAEAMTIITVARVYWFEAVLGGVFFPIMGILFKTTPEMVIAVGIVTFLPNGCTHLNVRWSLGRLALLINNPQYHRIHHSILPEHKDKNFAAVFPIWDIVCGTVWKPAKDEFPATGLTPGQQPVGFLDGVIWPIRHLLFGRARV
jgi:sterol desaturase/sphingolipid hydroxylase (fatty acid hydroxylase superfamily)